ncbi:helix-hairpin-helix domain-containing protein [Kribbella sp. HUAS MG21]|uniref:Helix-hairpin-helix domain-containing protein n=1 Tax=Kribbella sp. HUAS MG21 TaxID=3160966 RepID=A0AAU7T3H6_9ACTN
MRLSDPFKTFGSSRGIVEVMPTANPRVNATELTNLMNVGPAVADYLARAGITRTEQLTGRDPGEIYELICARDGQRHDPCLLDTIMSAVDQANGNPPRPWWTYTPQRKTG